MQRGRRPAAMTDSEERWKAERVFSSCERNLRATTYSGRRPTAVRCRTFAYGPRIRESRACHPNGLNLRPLGCHPERSEGSPTCHSERSEESPVMRASCSTHDGGSLASLLMNLRDIH